MGIIKGIKHNITNKLTPNLRKRVAIEISLNIKQINVAAIKTKNLRLKTKES